jgi:SulP family sulfate permease
MGLLPDVSPVALTQASSLLAGAGPVAWDLLLRRFPDLLAVSFIALLGTLLNASAIEVTVRQELDLNHDLKVVGLANVLAALFGSPPGFHSLSSSALPERMGAHGRGIGLVAAAVCGGALLGAQPLVGLLPFAITGGLLVFLGLSLLANWLIDKRPHLSPLEFAVLLTILLLTVTAGWMTALLFGLVLALLLFTVQYSRNSAIRSLLTARSRRSSVDRSPEANRLLDRHGDAILVICLQGHLSSARPISCGARSVSTLRRSGCDVPAGSCSTCIC